MKERASRYIVSAGSEEIELVPDEQEDNENQRGDDDEYLPPMNHRTGYESTKRIATGERPKSQIKIISPNVNDQTRTTSTNLCPESKSLTGEYMTLFCFLINMTFIYLCISNVFPQKLHCVLVS